ncbi:MAG TPA: hypothetical protein VNT55_18155 [Baekduia sp.]|nr:hypothetical protein [Baekduia sp.]
MSMRSRGVALVAAASVITTLAACGSEDPAPRATGTAAATSHVAAPRYLDRHALALGLGNGVRARLDQLAVMQQPPDAASDLGQSLPAGLLRDVACSPAGARPSDDAAWPWTCRVRWETVAGTTKTTNYAVKSFATGCFAAGADPRLPDVKDPTIASYSEHPLNVVTSLGKGC